jgi:hypothetical protein
VSAPELPGIGQPQQQLQQQACMEPHPAAAAAAGCSHTDQVSLSGHPMPLSLEALAGGSSGWCCGCVQVQQQEQSCWVRFNLPEALKQDASVVEAANKGLLVRGEQQAAAAAATSWVVFTGWAHVIVTMMWLFLSLVLLRQPSALVSNRQQSATAGRWCCSGNALCWCTCKSSAPLCAHAHWRHKDQHPCLSCAFGLASPAGWCCAGAGPVRLV